jgi:hypothetical protein
VYYLYAAVAAIFVAACGYCYQWRTVVALLSFQLVYVAEFCAWAEPFGQSELPSEYLMLANVAVKMTPLFACLAFHFVSLTVLFLASVTIKISGICMDRETENILVKLFVENYFAVFAVGVVVGGYIRMFGVIPSVAIHVLVYFFIFFACKLFCCLQCAFQPVFIGVAR